MPRAPDRFIARGCGAACLAALALLGACSQPARLQVADGTGPTPQLPTPATALIPTVNVAKAIGWPAGALPTAAPGTRVNAFASQLDHPRWLYVLPNNDVLVAESNAPPKPDDGKGLKGWAMTFFMKRAGAVTTSANRITLLRDTDGDGVADLRVPFIEGLNSPFGMVLVGNDLYVANTDGLVRYAYRSGQTTADGPPTLLTALPGGPINHHWTKNVVASADGNQLYVSIGSDSNVAERGMAAEAERAAIWEVDRQTGSHRVFASGLRNPVGMAWEPVGGRLWTVVNERDELGSDLVPDYLTSVQDGGFYGWPYSYFGQHVDSRVKPPQPELVARALVPDYALGPHTASLGLANATGNRLPEAFARGMFIGQHGSWNREPRSGYKVVFVPFDGAKPSGLPLDVLTGFLNAQGQAMGRPVGVAVDRQGALLVADDVGNVIWRVSAR